MPLKAIHVEVTDENLSKLLYDVLFEMGALSVSITDLHSGGALEQPIFSEPPPNNWQQFTTLRPWKNARIVAMYPQSTDVESLIMYIATNFELASTPSVRMKADSVEEKSPDDWVRHVQQNFQPIDLGRVRISFPWHPRRTDVIDVRVEPGAAFGTGEHPTTQLCASWLIQTTAPNMSVLDFGCGSGVLAIIATLLAKNVTAVGIDIDPDAVQVAHHNAVLNDVTDRTSFFHNDNEPQHRLYDIVVANILARQLKDLAEHLTSRLKPGGLIALSGIIVSQAPQLIEWYSQFGVTLQDANVSSGWAVVVGRKQKEL